MSLSYDQNVLTDFFQVPEVSMVTEDIDSTFL